MKIVTRSRKHKKRLNESGVLIEGHSPTISFQEGTHALFWLRKTANKPGRWVQGCIHEFVSAEERNIGCCSDAICACPKHTRGMYRYTIDKEEDDSSVASYFSEFDFGVKVNGLSGEKLWFK